MLDTKTHQLSTLAEAEGWSFRGLFAPLDSPLGFPSGPNAYLTASDAKGKTGIWKVQPLGGGLQLLQTIPHRTSSAPYRTVATQDGKKLFFFPSSVTNPGNVWQYDIASDSSSLVVEPNPFLQTGDFGERKILSWEDADGRKLQGVLLLPKGYKGGPLPTILWVYGGATGTGSMDSFGLDPSPVFNFEVLASRGYAVFEPEIPTRLGQPLEDIGKAVLSGTDMLVKEGYSDPERLAIMGQSYGSYTALCVLVQSQRFKAAVLTGAIVHPDLNAGFLNGPSYFLKGQGNLGVTPWADQEMYRRNSPFYKLDQVKTPILIGQGSEDSLETTKQLYTALEYAGVETELRVYADESHVIGSPAHVEDFWKRRLEFLDQHFSP